MILLLTATLPLSSFNSKSSPVLNLDQLVKLPIKTKLSPLTPDQAICEALPLKFGVSTCVSAKLAAVLKVDIFICVSVKPLPYSSLVM